MEPEAKETIPKKVFKNLYIVGEVNESTLRENMEELLERAPDEEPITDLQIYICSPGGFLHECFGLIDIINLVRLQFNVHITTIGLGEVSSAGFFLFLVGDTRILLSNAKVFVHEHINMGNNEKTYSEAVKDYKTIEKELNQMYTEYTADRLNITHAKARTLLRKNKWLTPKEIAAFNLETTEANGTEEKSS